MWIFYCLFYCGQLLEHDICLVVLFMCHCYCLYYCIFEGNKWRWRWRTFLACDADFRADCSSGLRLFVAAYDVAFRFLSVKSRLRYSLVSLNFRVDFSYPYWWLRCGDVCWTWRHTRGRRERLSLRLWCRSDPPAGLRQLQGTAVTNDNCNHSNHWSIKRRIQTTELRKWYSENKSRLTCKWSM